MSEYTDISVEEAYGMINTTGNLFILDVRTLEEFQSGYIENATLIPHTELESRANELPGDYQTEILVYCRSGARSATGSDTLVSMGYTQVYNMLGGFSAWKEAGYPYMPENITGSQGSSTGSSETQSTPVKEASIPLFIVLLSILSVIRLKQETSK
ncbi:MAG: rhodanese-like domain-containing protein [Candidatus Heimdallarchaeota archaeon]